MEHVTGRHRACDIDECVPKSRNPRQCGDRTDHIQFSHAAIHVHFRISVLPDKNRAEQEIRGDHRRQGKKVADPLCRIHLRNVLSEIRLQSANETAGRLFMVGNPRHSYV